MSRKPDCENLGLADNQYLAGFTSRAMAALAHLREAWCVADADNKAAIEQSIIALLEGHSFRDNANMVRTILKHTLDEQLGKDFLAAVGLG